MIKKILISIILLSNSISALAEVKSIKILLKVEDEIITNFDILKEANYLKAINKELKDVQIDQIFKLAENSLVKEIVKRNEIEKIYSVDYQNADVNMFLKNLMKYLNINNEVEFENYLSSIDIKKSEVKKKLIIEKLWNNLIYDKYIDKVKIDTNKLKEKVNLLTDQNYEEKVFLLNEIVFLEKDKLLFEKKYKEIIQSIQEYGFKKTAIIHSISETASTGGEIGWINERQLSETILKEIKNLKVNDYTRVINTSGGNLILQVSDIRNNKIEKKIDKDLELKKLVNSEKNRQLNEFSFLYYKKIENEIYIEKY
jgi:peptidyl-prolyl cis-trans isomerase SurA